MSAATNSGMLDRPRDRPVETAALRLTLHLGTTAQGALPGPPRPSRSASAPGSTSPKEAARRRPTVPRALRAPPSRALGNGHAPAQNPTRESADQTRAFPRPDHAPSHPAPSAPPGPSAPPAHDKAPPRPGPDATRAVAPLKATAQHNPAVCHPPSRLSPR